MPRSPAAPIRRLALTGVLLWTAGGVWTGCDLDPTGPETGPRLATVLVAGGFHGCWLDDAGAAHCWGDNFFGQLGTGVSGSEHTPSRVAGDVRFRALTAGLFHTCGLTDEGAVHCWGNNSGGGLGNESTRMSATMVATIGAPRLRSIDAGGLHTCGLTDGGVAHCWGLNASGQIGVRTSRHVCGGAPCDLTPSPVGGDLTLASITAGANHTCGITHEGTLYCWGDNTWGQLGTGTRTAVARPVLVTTSHRFRSVSAGTAHTCAVADDGAVLCWGRNEDGQIGVSHGMSLCTGAPCTLTPLSVATPARFRVIAAGGGHTCALTATGLAYCWGRNRMGQLGDGQVFNRTEPDTVSGSLRFRSISAGELHTCGVTVRGDAYCWGDNFREQIGNGGVGFRRSEPTRVLVPEGS